MRTLLVVEDDSSVRRVIREMLKGMDFAIEEVPDGSRALAALSKSLPDLIILDLLLPELNGLQFLDTLKEQGIASSTPIVVITGTITPEPVIREKGARGVLRKPFTRAELRGAVETVLRSGRVNRERPRPGLLGRLRRPPCILIVEDDRGVQHLLETILRIDGYETMTASNGAEALTCMRRRKPCAVLLDLMLPTMDGWQFRRRQLLEPALANVPVVCMTGYANPDEVAHELGVTCLRKPLDVRAVLTEVEHSCQLSDG